MLGPAVHRGQDTTHKIYSAQCWKSYAQGSNIVALRRSRNKEMLGVVGSKVWPVSSFAQQLRTAHNNTQQSVQTDTTCNIQKCWELLANIVASVCMGLNVWRPKQAGACKCSKNNSYIAWCTFLQNKISRKIFLDLCHAIDRINQLFICFLYPSSDQSTFCVVLATATGSLSPLPLEPRPVLVCEYSPREKLAYFL